MSGPFGSSPWGYNPGGDFYSYTIDQSLRFEDGSSAYLSRTPATAGNRKTWTWSGWVKRCSETNAALLMAGPSGDTNNFTGIFFIGSSNIIDVQMRSGGASDILRLQTSRVFRDFSAWYHLVFVLDLNNATQADRFRIYVNGSRVTDFSTNTNTLNSTQSFDVNNTVPQYISRSSISAGDYLDGYLAEINFIDGQALDPTSFGETKDGIWIPKAYSGSYGTNGFYLPFDDSSAIGDDESGNTNDWTVNNLVATDVVPDSPTNNFAVINQLDSNVTISEGNLKALGISGTYFNAKGSFNFDVGLSDGWYFEFISISGSVNEGSVGIALSSYLFSNASSTTLINDTKTYNPDGSINFSTTFAGDTWGNGDIIGVAVKNGKVYYSKNGVFQASADPVNETNPAHTGLTGFYAAFMYSASSGAGGVFNFGQDSSFAGLKTSGSANGSDDNGIGDFYYAVPSGYLALCTANLPTPSIVDGSEHFNTVLVSGNSGTQSVTGVGFQPDLTWNKTRNVADNHVLIDSVRGDYALRSNGTIAEYATGVSWQFDADGFTMTGTTGELNYSGRTYAAWNWKAGGTAVSNTDGSITSQVSANTDAGFSIVSYVGTGSVATVGHGLGAAPDMIIVKNRDDAAGKPWVVYHSSNTSAPETDYLLLNTTAGTVDGLSQWNDTAPTSTVFTVGTSTSTNQSLDGHIAYCFANSDTTKVGSYTGNGQTDERSPYIHTGFRPAWIMVKRAVGGTSNWDIMDAVRNTYNVVDLRLYANLNSSEPAASDYVDFTSNGFKVRNTVSSQNTNGSTYIYLAFAETPFKYANAR